ncbi:MAG: hydroxymethylglutaryl-CoA reductase [Elusimicrobiota bacterium]|nr:hydroxymethylglutaryl-CoA reductase [Elusimicrobiota bacterium]
MQEKLSLFKFPKQEYTKEYITKRVKWLSKQTETKLFHITQYTELPTHMRGNIENLIGMCQIPLGITGPLRVNGTYAKGDFYIPLATTEGSLVMTYHYGMRVISKAGGVNTSVLKNEMHVSPVFMLKDIKEITQFLAWINNNFQKIKKEAEKTTRHGKLLKIEPVILGSRVILKFSYHTGDAMGANMIARATEEACQFISKKTQKKFFIKSNYSSDKKVTAHNFINGYGKMVLADVTISRKDVVELLNTTPEEIYSCYHAYLLSALRAGMVGTNCHFANGIAALFIACGQDVASTVNSHVGISTCECTSNGDLYVSIYLPSIIVGTLGGGTGLATQRECLELLGCYGTGKAEKFAEIVAAVSLAGEIAVGASVANGTFVEGHEKYGRNKPKDIT